MPSPPDAILLPASRVRPQGTDGRERGEDDTAFEKQSALFAMAAADVLLVNMWCHDIGRESGAGKPLLKIVFQARIQTNRPRPYAKHALLKFAYFFRFRERSTAGQERMTAAGARGRLSL